MRAGPLLLSAVDCNSVSRNVIIINILTCYSGIKIDWPLQHKYGQPCYVTVASYIYEKYTLQITFSHFTIMNRKMFTLHRFFTLHRAIMNS